MADLIHPELVPAESIPAYERHKLSRDHLFRLLVSHRSYFVPGDVMLGLARGARIDSESVPVYCSPEDVSAAGFPIGSGDNACIQSGGREFFERAHAAINVCELIFSDKNFVLSSEDLGTLAALAKAMQLETRLIDFARLAEPDQSGGVQDLQSDPGVDAGNAGPISVSDQIYARLNQNVIDYTGFLVLVYEDDYSPFLMEEEQMLLLPVFTAEDALQNFYQLLQRQGASAGLQRIRLAGNELSPRALRIPDLAGVLFNAAGPVQRVVFDRAWLEHLAAVADA